MCCVCLIGGCSNIWDIKLIFVKESLICGPKAQKKPKKKTLTDARYHHTAVNKKKSYFFSSHLMVVVCSIHGNFNTPWCQPRCRKIFALGSACRYMDVCIVYSYHRYSYYVFIQCAWLNQTENMKTCFQRPINWLLIKFYFIFYRVRSCEYVNKY